MKFEAPLHEKASDREGRGGEDLATLLGRGILSLLMGIIIWRAFPLSARWVIGLFVGIRLIFKGLEQIMRSESIKPGADQRGDRVKRAA